MPPLIRNPELFIVPDSLICWASMMHATLIVLDVSTELGEYHKAIQHGTKWGKDAKRTINVVTLQVVGIGMFLIVVSSMLVTNLTKDMDSRMVLVLEGISRLEASILMAFISVKAPRWIGVYHSPEKEQCVKHVGEGIEALKFHVRYTLGQYFVLVYCLMLPFSASPQSAILGLALGFIIEIIILFAQKEQGPKERHSGDRPFRVSSIVSMVFAFFSSFMMADGCHYIQVVWGSGLIFSEWGLGIATFFASFAAILSAHFYHLQRTVRKFVQEQRISSHERKNSKMAISIIRDHLFGSINSLNDSQRSILKEEKSENATTTTWTLLKGRAFAHNDLVVFSRFEYYVGLFISVASLFLVIVNIGATKQIDAVRLNYHAVHDTLYGAMDQGPVCAFDKIGGDIRTFNDIDTARSAGYTLAHCGGCGKCSTWNDLRLQYTTRNYLAKESQKCAKKSLIYGRDAVHTCLQDDPIGFSDQCASCWTEDILCARRHCAFIFLQSNMINTVSNFQVGADIITAATCEEAMCELDFVPCSGANRRRMKISSSIARSTQQMCSIIDIDWATVFTNNIEEINESRIVDGKDEL